MTITIIGSVRTTTPVVVDPTSPGYTGNYNYSSIYTNIYNALINIESELSTIDASLATMALNSTAVKNDISTLTQNSTQIKTFTEKISQALIDIESHQKIVKDLANGPGIHMISPYEAFSFVTSYRSLIEEGRILKWRDLDPTDKDVSKALNDLERYIEKIRNNVPRAF
jgi:hypothetical protein